MLTHNFKDIVFSRDRSVQDVLKTEERSRVEGFKKQLMALAAAGLPAMTPGCCGKQSRFQVWRFYFPAMPYLQLSRQSSKPQSLGTSKSCDAAIERFDISIAFTWTRLDRKHSRTSSPQGRARIPSSMDDRAKHVRHSIFP